MPIMTTELSELEVQGAVRTLVILGKHVTVPVPCMQVSWKAMWNMMEWLKMPTPIMIGPINMITDKGHLLDIREIKNK